MHVNKWARRAAVIFSAVVATLAVAAPAFCAASAAPDAAVTDAIGSIGLTIGAYLVTLIGALVGVVVLGVGIRFLLKGAKIFTRGF